MRSGTTETLALRAMTARHNQRSDRRAVRDLTRAEILEIFLRGRPTSAEVHCLRRPHGRPEDARDRARLRTPARHHYLATAPGEWGWPTRIRFR